MTDQANTEAAALLTELTEAGSLEDLRPTAKLTPGQALGMDAVQTTHTQRVDEHLFADWITRQAAVVKHLDRLPKPGQVLHVITGGDFNGTDILPALITMDGARCATECIVTTLGFSQANVRLLAAMLDSSQIKTLSIICSYYFARASKEIYALSEHELVPRGVRLMNTRCHAKITLALLDTGRHYVIETSANLRSCICLEQLTITEDAKLYDFHKKWIEHLFSQHTTEAK